MKNFLIFNIEGIPTKEILESFGFTIKGDFVVLEENKMIPINAVEMIVSGEDGKPKLLIDPLEVSDFFYMLDDEENKKEE